MKSILLSIKPKWVEKILNGEKTIEIRKTMPKCDLPIDVYIYCTKDKEKLYDDYPNVCSRYKSSKNYTLNDFLNGKVVAKFTLRKVEEIRFDLWVKEWFTESIETEKELLTKSCLTQNELDNYLDGHIGYGWHIEDLVFFDTPKRLTWFRGMKEDVDFVGKPYKKFLKRPPQNYCFVEVEE